MREATCRINQTQAPDVASLIRARLAVEFSALAATSRLPELKPEFSLIALTFT
jgi:hypothetical protein